MNSKTETLITRGSTALVFVAIVLAAIFHSHLTRSVLLFFIFFGASFEYLKMFSKQSMFLLLLYSFIIAFIPFSLMELWPTESDIFKYFTIPVILFYILNIYNLYSKRDILRHHNNLWIYAPLYFGFGYLSSIFLFEHDYLMDDILIQVIVLIWICDSAAYLVGSQIGKTKLFPSISPNKTWEGSIGAGIFTIIAGFVMNRYFPLFDDYLSIVLLAICIWIFGTYGDLVQSYLKRKAQIKDSGTLMPGHGGVFDRFDSFIYVIPFLAFLKWMFVDFSI